MSSNFNQSWSQLMTDFILSFESQIIIFISLLITALIVSDFVTLVIKHLYSFLFPRKNCLREVYPFKTSLLLLKNYNRLWDWFKDIYTDEEKKGRITFLINIYSFPVMIFTSDMRNIQYILRDNSESYCKHRKFKNIFQNLLNQGAVDPIYERLHDSKNKSHDIFKLDSFKERVLDILNESITQLIIVLDHTDENYIDFKELFKRFSLEIMTKISFGKVLGSLLDRNASFVGDFDYCAKYIGDLFFSPSSKANRYFSLSGWKYYHCLSNIDIYVSDIISAKKKMKKEKKESINDLDLVSLFLKKDYVSGDEKQRTNLHQSFIKATDNNLRDILINIILSGRENTTNALCWAFYRLCSNRCTQGIIRAEVRCALQAVDGKTKSYKDAISHESLLKMRYLEAFCMEVLRLHPSVPMEMKTAKKTDILPDGNIVNKDDLICFHPWVMGRNKAFWGPDAEKFDPMRFLKKSTLPYNFSSLKEEVSLYSGQTFTILEMKTCIARLILYFQFFLAREEDGVTYETTSGLPIKGPLLISAKVYEVC